jgi:predicted AlkP superfamily phosphohydrolase/phosphomutase
MSREQAAAGTTRRVCVIGLDGTPASLLRRLIAAGEMPALASLASQGVGEAIAPLPPVSSVSWASATTGQNPGRHGVFGFVERDRASYGITFTTADSIKVSTAWDRAGEAGLNSLIVNIPGTFPARPLSGVLIAGFVSPTLNRAVWPQSLLPELERIGYAVDVELSLGHRDLSAFVDELFRAHEARRAAFRLLLEREPWDLAYLAFTGTDRLHHFLWAQMEDGEEPWASHFLRYYREVDAGVADIVERLPPETEILLLSDHGFCRLEREVYINRLLERDGWLTLGGDGTRLAELDPTRTRAYALDPSRIYVNLRGREPEGVVEPSERDGVVAELKQWAEEFPWVERAVPREEAFDGPESDRAPDLVLVTGRGFDPKGSLRSKDTEGRSVFTGMHTYDDAFVVWAGHSPAQDSVRVETVAATALELLDLDISALNEPALPATVPGP